MVATFNLEDDQWSVLWQKSATPAYLWHSQQNQAMSAHLGQSLRFFLVLMSVLILLVLLLCTSLWWLLWRNQSLLKQAKELSHTKDAFFANMNHELRTPLNGIIATISLLKDKNKECELIDILDYSSEALLSQINTVLDYSLITSKRVQLNDSVFDLSELVANCVKVFHSQTETKAIELLLNAPSGSCFVYSDENKIRQILLNIVANAVKFTSKGRITVSCELTFMHDSVNVDIKVDDTGVGIKPAYLNRIFDSFQQAEYSVKNQYGGTGLGLSICKTLLDALGGTILVKSVYQQGSCFQITMPLTLAKQLHKSTVNKQEDASNTLNALHVLLVEDNVVNQKIAKKMLQHLNVTVSVVDNGLQALQCDLSNIDLVLMDLQMPKLDGLQATKQLRARGERLPIIAITANATEKDRQACLLVGMNDCISKPYQLDTLKKMLLHYQSNSLNSI